MKVILKAKDGSVAVMALAPGADKEDAIRKFKDAHPGMYTDHFEIDDKELPVDREFRDAWTVSGNKITLDKMKAKALHLGRVREARDKELDKLDKQHLRYLSKPDKVKEIEDKKQVLRDLPKTIKDLEWPDMLERV